MYVHKNSQQWLQTKSENTNKKICNHHISMENVAYAFDFYGILHLLRYQHIPFEIGIALHYVPNAHCWVYITDPIRWYCDYFIHEKLCDCIRQKWYYRAVVVDLWMHFFNISNMHTVHSTALRTSMQFHFLRLICINPNNSNKSSANESRKTTTIPKLLAAR